MIKRIITLPGRFVRATWHFIEPPLKVGRIPFGRTVLVLQAIAAVTFIGYTLVKKDVQFPWSPEPYVVDVLLADAQGLHPPKEPSAGVAGVVAGKVVAMRVENGQARATLRLDSDYRGKIFNDATVEVRPTSVLQTLIVNIKPGNPESGTLDEETPIAVADVTNFVAIDDLTGILDADTQAQVQILISEAARAMKGREPQLRKILVELGRVTDSAAPLADALADRRRLLSRLTGNLDDMFTTLGQRGTQLANAVELGSQTLAVTAGRETELADVTRQLGPTLRQTQQALLASRLLAEPLVPALDELVPVANLVEPTASKLRELAPELDQFITLADRLVDEGRKPARLLSNGLKGQARRVREDQIPALKELVDLVELLTEYQDGLIQFAEGWSGAVSTNRNAGTYAQFAIVNADLTCEGFGVDPDSPACGVLEGILPAQARAGTDEAPTRLARMFAEMLEHTCRDSNPAACLIRFNTPGLPAEPLLEPIREAGGGR